MSPLATERRRRIRVAVAAYAYEIENAPVLDDAAFDALANAVQPEIATGHAELDAFFRQTFEPHTGQWIHAHPDLIGVERAWRRWTAAAAAPDLHSDLPPDDRALLTSIEQGDRPSPLAIANAAEIAPDKALIRLLAMAARGIIAADDTKPRRWSLLPPAAAALRAPTPPPAPIPTIPVAAVIASAAKQSIAPTQMSLF